VVDLVKVSDSESQSGNNANFVCTCLYNWVRWQPEKKTNGTGWALSTKNSIEKIDFVVPLTRAKWRKKRMVLPKRYHHQRTVYPRRRLGG